MAADPNRWFDLWDTFVSIFRSDGGATTEQHLLRLQMGELEGLCDSVGLPVPRLSGQPKREKMLQDLMRNLTFCREAWRGGSSFACKLVFLIVSMSLGVRHVRLGLGALPVRPGRSSRGSRPLEDEAVIFESRDRLKEALKNKTKDEMQDLSARVMRARGDHWMLQTEQDKGRNAGSFCTSYACPRPQEPLHGLKGPRPKRGAGARPTGRRWISLFAKSLMKFHICTVLLCLVQDGQALRDANEKNGKSSLNPDVNETKEASCGTQCSIKKKTNLPSELQHEVDEETNYTHQPRKRDIPNWSEKYDKDPHGHLHMGSALGTFMIALLLQWTTQPQQRKDAVTNAMRKARKPRFLNQAAARADVDAEGSDSEDEATSSSDLGHATPWTVMKLGPGMRFIDEDLEEEWEKESYPKNQQRGAVLLALVAFGLAVDRFYAFYELQSCKGDQWWMQKSLQIGCILVMGKVFAFLCMVPAVEGARSEAQSFFLPSKFWDSAYWIVLGFFAFFFIMVNLWPFSPSCEILSLMARACEFPSVRIAHAKLDCTLQGHTACQMIQLWMLIMPYALPQFRSFHLTFLWLGFLYVGVSWLYAEISGEKTHMVDLGLHFSMLVVTAILGTMKKYYLEKGMRRQFLEDNLQRKKKFKMGIHTGEIHAGVIGQKLPRFRLFGDTINTSARMMQKASPGQLLFGEATNRILPSSLKVKEADGIIVKMKGKGDVKAFYYDETNFPKSSAPAKDPAGPEKPKDCWRACDGSRSSMGAERVKHQDLPWDQVPSGYD
eukprot:s31_g23.t1